MPGSGDRLKTALDGYARYLKDKDLALPKQQPDLVRWVREVVFRDAPFRVGLRRERRH